MSIRGGLAMPSGPLLLAARVLLAIMFLVSGWTAVTDLSGTAAYMGELGLPLPSFAALATGLFETAGGLLLVVGLLTRPVALLLAAFSLVATWLGHYGQGADGFAAFMHWQAFLKDVAVAGGLVALAMAGPGPLSADAGLRRKS